MTKAELKALQTYPDDKPESWGDVSISHKNERQAYIRGYYHAIEDAMEWLENYMKGVAGSSVYVEDFKKFMEE